MPQTLAEKAREIASLALPTLEGLQEKAYWEKFESVILAAAKRGKFSCLVDADEVDRSMTNYAFRKGLLDRGLKYLAERKSDMFYSHNYKIFW